MTPPLPIVTINHKNALDILNGDYPLDQTTLYGYIKHKDNNCVYYDKDGNKWTSSFYSRKYKPTLLTRMLANTFYNPIIRIERTWTNIGRYELAELIETVNQVIDLDDDVLTQFTDGSTLKRKVSQADSFDKLVQLLLDYVFKPNPNVIEEVI